MVSLNTSPTFLAFLKISPTFKEIFTGAPPSKRFHSLTTGSPALGDTSQFKKSIIEPKTSPIDPKTSVAPPRTLEILPIAPSINADN